MTIKSPKRFAVMFTVYKHTYKKTDHILKLGFSQVFQLFTSTLTLAAETRLQRIKGNMSEINTTLPSECRLCPRFHSGNTAETSRPSWFVFTLQGFKICIRSCLYRKQRKNCCNALFSLGFPRAADVGSLWDGRADIRFST